MTWNAVRRISTLILHQYSDNWLCACTQLVWTVSISLFKRVPWNITIATAEEPNRKAKELLINNRTLLIWNLDLKCICTSSLGLLMRKNCGDHYGRERAGSGSISFCPDFCSPHTGSQISQPLFLSSSSHWDPQKSSEGSQPCPLYPAFSHSRSRHLHRDGQLTFWSGPVKQLNFTSQISYCPGFG